MIFKFFWSILIAFLFINSFTVSRSFAKEEAAPIVMAPLIPAGKKTTTPVATAPIAVTPIKVLSPAPSSESIMQSMKISEDPTASYGSEIPSSKEIGAKIASPNLLRALQLAYLNNPNLSAQKQAMRQAFETAEQRSAPYWKPTIDLRASTSRNLNDPYPSQSTIPLNVDLSQNLFSFGGGLNTLKQNKIDIEAQYKDFLSKEQDFLMNVITAYLDVLKDSASLKVKEYQLEHYQKDLEAIKARFITGDKTKTDVLAVQAKAEEAFAQAIEARASLQARIAFYEQLVGEKPIKINEDIPTPKAEIIVDSEAVTTSALDNNPDYKKSVLTEQSKSIGKSIAKTSLLPTVSFNAGVAGDLKKLNKSNNTSTSIGLTLTMPLYRPASNAQTRVAANEHELAKLNLRNARLKITTDCIASTQSYQAKKAGIEKIRAGVKAQEEALKGVRIEFEAGSKNVLDLLQAEQQLLSVKLSLVEAQYSLALSYYKLLQVMGELTARSLNLDVEYFDPYKDYKKNVSVWGYKDY